MGFNPQKQESKEYDLIEEGLYKAVVARVIELGDQEDKFGVKTKVVMAFTIPDLTIEIDGEQKQRMMFTFPLNQTSNPDSTLMKYIKAIDGSVTHMSQLLGKPCMIEVAHTKKSDGTVYANISNITKPMKGMTFNAPDCDVYMFEFDNPNPEVWEKLSDGRKDTIKKAKNFNEVEFNKALKTFKPSGIDWQYVEEHVNDDDIPF